MHAEPAYSQFEYDLETVIWFLAKNDVHRNWSYNDIARLIVPPLKLEQYIIDYDSKATPIGFTSWAWLSDEAQDGFINETRKIRSSDWLSGDNAWIIDVVSNNQNPMKMLRRLEDMFLNYTDAKKVSWFRRYPDGRKRISSKEMY